MKTDHDHVTTKFWAGTKKALKIIAAETDETMVEVIDRLAKMELERIKAKDASAKNG